MSTKQARRASDDDINTYRGKIQSKQVVINRSAGPARGVGGSSVRYSFGGRTSMGGGMGMGAINPQVMNQLASSQVADFKNTRVSEKKEMQGLNEKLADYIQRVRMLETHIRELEAELEILRRRKPEDWKNIRDKYEGELNQARKVIEELSTQKGVSEARLAGYQDEIANLKDLIGTQDGSIKDLNRKLDAANQQVGEIEGELTTLRLRCGTLEDEANRLRDLVAKLKGENATLRGDLDAATCAQIETDIQLQGKIEECEFLTELLNTLELMKQEPVTVGGKNLKDFYSGEMKNAIREIQGVYDETLAVQQAEMEGKFSAQLQQMQSGQMRDTYEIEKVREENKRLKGKMDDSRARIADLEQKLAAKMAELENMMSEFDIMKREKEDLEISSSRRIGELSEQIEALIAQLQQLVDYKMSLELEIACYRKLLDGEENRSGLKQLVEQSMGVRGDGANKLADIIGQSS